jgi:hypothetical protein
LLRTLGLLEQEPHVHPSAVRDMLLRQVREADGRRILSRQDVDVDALRRRMVRGLSPRETMWDVIQEVRRRERAS